MIDQRIGISIISAIAGAFILYWFFWPEIETKTEVIETKTTDTVFVTVRDTVRIRQVKHEYLRDTVLIDFKPQIKAFKASVALLYGNTYVNGEVLGEVLKMDISNDFKIPQVTNTLVRETRVTNTIKPKALYLGAGVNSLISPFAKVDYIDNQFIFSYQYYPIDRVHAIGVSKKLF